MGGRGRGRGKPATSVSTEQLGLSKETQLPQVLQPPPKFPPLAHKAVKPEITDALIRLVALKSDFAEYMRESPHYVEPVIIKKDIDRYSDKYDSTVKSRYESMYDWTRMPAELKPVSLKRKEAGSSGISAKKKKEVNIEERLKALEKKETNKDFNDEEEDTKDKENDDEDDPDEVRDEDDVDEEMDDGTDYAKDYFDNGEGYDDEEDNNEDGPVY